MNTGIVVFAHGSSVPEANESVRAVAKQMAGQGGFALVEPAFLEQGVPDLAGAIDRLVTRGAGRILVVPYFLTLGIHLKKDLPRIVAGLSRIHSNMEIRVAPPLDGHPAMAQALIERVRESEMDWDRECKS